MSDLKSDLFNLAMSAEAQPLMDAVKQHIAQNVEPITEEFFALDKEKDEASIRRGGAARKQEEAATAATAAVAE